jgi:hypothetical protein
MTKLFTQPNKNQNNGTGNVSGHGHCNGHGMVTARSD